MREFDPQMMAKYNSFIHLKPTALAAALLCLVTSASALIIDRAGGSIVLGRPLDVMFKVSVAPDEELNNVCAAANVSYGDAPLDASRISVSSEPGTSPNTLDVRVRSSSPVDEPLVTFEIKAGCKQVVSRRFVLLSELSSDIQRPTPAQPSAAVPTVQIPVVTALVVPAPVAAPAVPSVVRVKPKKEISKPALVPTPMVMNTAGDTKSRLKLSPIDLSQDWDPVLQISFEMLSLPQEDPAKRSEAAALWRYLNLSPKDYLRLSSQEDELNKLKQMMEKSQQQLQEMNQQLQTAEEQRYANPVVYFLVALVLLLLGGAAYLYHRLGGRGIPNAEWWRTLHAKNEFKPSGFADADDALVLDSKQASEIPAKAKIPVQTTPSQSVNTEQQDSNIQEVAEELDFELDVNVDVAPDAPPEPAPVVVQQKDTEYSMSAALRSINTHDMLDVRQQAEFFMTLGQYEDAIDMLQNSIQQNDAANPLIYLDLLKVLHTLSRKTEFDSIRKDFNRIFSGRVPPYIAFNEPTKALDTYHELCERIVATWPQPSSIELIEQSLVRGTVHVATGRLDLEAFRDLLMLHDIAKQYDESGIAQNHVFSAAKMDLETVNDFADSEPMGLDVTPITIDEPQEVVTDLLLPPVFEDQAAEIDLDLSEPKTNLIDFDPSIFSLDLPETKKD